MADGSTHEGQHDSALRGFVVYRASRLSELLPNLRLLLDAAPPADPFAPQTVIAGHPGIRQWLEGALARERGPGGIVANTQVMLPSSWIDRLAVARLGEHAVALARYRRDHLRWWIHELLGDGDIARADPRVSQYLNPRPGEAEGSASQARRHFQLADRLAGLYSQYVVYRPDWLTAWAAGKDGYATGGGDMASTEAHLLAPLWRGITGQLGKHRGEIIEDLIADLHCEATDREPLHVFGVAHLPPRELAVLRAYARQALVVLYVPDPCREYWAGLVGTGAPSHVLTQHLNAERERIAQAGAADYWVEQSHPLLASWGRMGQHFMMSLADGDEIVAERRSAADEVEVPADARMPRLARLQQSIREMDIARLKPRTGSSWGDERRDGSLRVHACHTPLRELEVLKDVLLDALASGIAPDEMLVMAPRIATYAPLVPAVFGKVRDLRSPLPYHLADVGTEGGHRMVQAFVRVIDICRSRVTTPEVVDLIRLPEVGRRFDMDMDGSEELIGWLRETRVAWAIDAAFRSSFGLPAGDQATFAWAVDRLLAGFVMADGHAADDPTVVRLPDGTAIAPVQGVQHPAAAHAGALVQVLQQLQGFCALAGKTQTAAGWAEDLATRFDALFAVDPADTEAVAARACIHSALRTLATETRAAGVDPELHYGVVRDLVVAALEAPPQGQRFLAGGVTFCGMVPQRSVPFRLIAVLGLNDGDFPRNAASAGLDLMARYRRVGDRDVRMDDRYLFLETVMSAGERLHLSFVGIGVTDGESRNPAAPLGELIAALGDADQGRIDTPRGCTPAWHVAHPLQPFDARYFADDPALFTYDAVAAVLHRTGDAPGVTPFYRPGVGSESSAISEVDLQEVCRYFKDPARNLLSRRLDISLDALEGSGLSSDEPLEAGLPAMESIERRMLLRYAVGQNASDLPEHAPDWLQLTGLLPPGRLGQRTWTAVREFVDELRALLDERLQALTPGAVYNARGLSPSSERVDATIHGRRVTGTVNDVFALGTPQHRILLRSFAPSNGRLRAEDALHFKYRIPLFLDWALLRLTCAGLAGMDCPRLSVLPLVRDPRWSTALDDWDRRYVASAPTDRVALKAILEARVHALIEHWSQACNSPGWYFPTTSWQAVAAARTEVDVAPEDGQIYEEEMGNAGIDLRPHWHRERDYAPGYMRLLAGDLDFEPGSAEFESLDACARALNQCISLAAEEVA